jgi:uncharacterized phage protein gp47/JayE
MKVTPQPPIDQRDYLEIFEEVRARTPGYAPELNLTRGTVGAGLGSIFARYAQAVLQRLNQAPDKNKLAFLDLLALHLTPPQSARAAMVFQLNDKASSGIAPASTAVAAPPPPGSSDQIVFETEQALSVMAGKLAEVFSLWPGRDAFIDHSATYAAREPIRLFSAVELDTIPHHLYLAHEKLFALAGRAKLTLELQLLVPGSDPLDIQWEYWDGKGWRSFFDISPACRPNDPTPPDGTAGMSANGRIELTSDGATSDKAAIGGFTNYWVRGRLTKALPSAGDARLPLIDAVKLSSTVEQLFRMTLKVAPESTGLKIAVRNAAGRPVPAETAPSGGQTLPGVSVTIRSKDQDPVTLKAKKGNPSQFEGINDEAPPDSLTIVFFGVQQTVDNLDPLLFSDTDNAVNVDLNLIGIAPDTALADATKLDTTKPFFPFGQQPQPGSTFYFSNQEAFTKPGAMLRIYLPLTSAPLGSIASDDSSNGREPLRPTIEWEYWNGRAWATLLPAPSNQGARDFSKSEIVDFTVPVDMETTTVAGTEARWMRARLVSGGFGYTQAVKWQAGTGANPPVNTITYVVNQPPVLADIQLSYTWQYGPFHPDRVISYNDFQYTDHTDQALWPGTAFLPYERTADVTPALYLGFDHKPPGGQIGVFLNVLEQRGDVNGPALTWEYWDGSDWSRLTSSDETRNLRLPGIVSLITEDDSAPLARFDTKALFWVRGRLKDDGPPGEPTLNGIFPNAVWASQRTTLGDLPIGQSNGALDQMFSIPQIPILDGERIELREIVGPRANVEWRILASELFQGDAKVVEKLENQLAREGGEPNIIEGDLRLRRDRLKKVSEVWVRWTPQLTLAGCRPTDRCYTIDRARGLLQFGDGKTGRVPVDGASILGRTLQSGGGQAGNVPARSISQMRGVVVGVDAAFNPLPAEGGADGEPLSEFVKRGPKSVRHRGRAVGVDDYATLAKEASSAVGYARAIPTRDPAGHMLPGWVSVLIIPRSLDPRPQPSFGLRQQVQQYIDRRAPAELAGDDRVFVVGPEYLEIDVTAVVSPVSASEAGIVEQAAREALLAFLHPLTGGPSGEGWDLGRSVFLSDVASALRSVSGIDHIEDLALLLDSQPQGTSVTVSASRIAVAGAIHIQLASPPA